MVLRIYYDVSPTEAAWVTVGAFVLIRVLAVHFNWQTRSVADGPIVGRSTTPDVEHRSLKPMARKIMVPANVAVCSGVRRRQKVAIIRVTRPEIAAADIEVLMRMF
jgi:hypothetical protein